MFCLTCANQVNAHARWALDGLVKPRNNSTGLKTGPCGGIARTNTPVQLQSGSVVDVKFETVIYHQGVFKIYFSPSNDQNFVLLADNIPDYADKPFQTYKLTLPNQECNGCTLQLIQTMPDHGPNSLYYSCADIQLVKPTMTDIVPPAAVTNLSAQQQDKHLSLSWANPSADYFKTLVLQASQPVQATPNSGTAYQVGDGIGNAKVVANAASNQFASTDLPLQQTTYFAVIAYDGAHNYATPKLASGQVLPAPNIAPQISLSAEQSTVITSQINTADGPVVVQARMTDANTTDTHSYDWSAKDYRLVDTDNNPSTFTFNPENLPADTYKIVATVKDSGMPPLSTKATLELQFNEPFIRGGALDAFYCALLALALILGGAKMDRYCKDSK